MSRPSFRLNHIALLQAVMTSQTLTEAAQRLHVSQPAISKQLKQLQSDLGFLLFERQGHRLIPTFEARAMLDQVTRVNASLDVLNQLASGFGTARRGHFRSAVFRRLQSICYPKRCTQPWAQAWTCSAPSTQVIRHRLRNGLKRNRSTLHWR